MKKFLAAINAALARAVFRRKRHAIAEDAAVADELAQTVPDMPPPSEPLPPADATATPPEPGDDTTNDKPGLAAQLAARLSVLAFWRRKAATGDDAPEQAADKMVDSGNAPAKPDATVDDEEAAPRPPIAKRVLAFMLKKSVWMPAAAVLLVTLSAGAAITFMHAQQHSQEKALQTLQAAKLKLERENKQLRTQQAIIRAPSDKKTGEEKLAATHAAEASERDPDPAFDAAGKTSPSHADGGDCVVTDKSNVAESLKSCIAAFNQTTTLSRQKR